MVCLCRTVHVTPYGGPVVMEAMQELLQAWMPTRAALQDLHVIA